MWPKLYTVVLYSVVLTLDNICSTIIWPKPIVRGEAKIYNEKEKKGSEIKCPSQNRRGQWCYLFDGSGYTWIPKRTSLQTDLLAACYWWTNPFVSTKTTLLSSPLMLRELIVEAWFYSFASDSSCVSLGSSVSGGYQALSSAVQTTDVNRTTLSWCRTGTKRKFSNWTGIQKIHCA